MKKVKRNLVLSVKISQNNNFIVLFKIFKCFSNIQKYCKLFKIIYDVISHLIK